MIRRWRAGRALAGLGAALTITAGVATAAGAHEPVFVTAADPTPATGPLLEDGNHSWAVYGVLDAPGATRGVRTQLRAGQTLVVDLLIPARSPEQDLPTADLPRVTVQWPDGTRRRLDSNLRVAFDEPFTGTSYLRIAELREPTRQTGVHELTVTGGVPARFTLATGTVEGFGGAKRDTEPPPAGGLAAWYSTPPRAVAATPSSTTTTSGPTRSVAAATGREQSTDASPEPWLVALGLALVGGVAAVTVIRRHRER